MSEVDLVGLLIEWWWLLLFVMRPGLLNLAGGYFAGVYLAKTKPDTAQQILEAITKFIGGLQS